MTPLPPWHRWLRGALWPFYKARGADMSHGGAFHFWVWGYVPTPFVTLIKVDQRAGDEPI